MSTWQEGLEESTLEPARTTTRNYYLVIGVLLAVIAWALWVRLFADRSVPGWASTVLPVVTLGGLQLFCTGIIGEYLAKVYLETKRRPPYFIDRVV